MNEQSKMRTDLNGEISFADIFHLFRKNWKPITFFGVLGLASSAIFVLIVPAQYESTMQIKMAQYSSGSIEPTIEVVERLKLPTAYTDVVLRECEVTEGENVGLYMNGRVKAYVMRGVADAIEIKVRSSNLEGAKSCAKALFNMISSQQQGIIEVTQNEEQQQVKQLEEEYVNEAKQLRPIGQNIDGAIKYLVNFDKLTSLHSRIDSMNDEILFAKWHPTKLLSPIYTPNRPVFPIVPMIVLLGTLVGLVLGVIFVTLLNQYRRLSEQK